MASQLGRRGFIASATALSVGLWPAAPVRAASAMGFDEARHLLSRTSFGATPAEVHALETVDYAGAVDRLLGNIRRTAATPAPDWVTLGPAEVRRQQQMADAQRKEASDGKKLDIVRPVQEQGRELKNWWIEEMLATDQPLVERMVLFWHNHFTSSMLKVRYAPALFRQNALFRREALGNYATLLRDVARDPAMLIYLDGMRSVARQPNENFARELLELFTLGEGHYAEADIKAAARAFTGWSVNRETGQFVERPGQHDSGEKTFLGKTGRLGGEDIVTILLAQPRTAETIVEKLWLEFVSLKPDRAEVARLAGDFRRSGYEIKPLVRAILLSPAFRDPANRGALIKSPVDLIVGSVHVLGLPVPEKTGLLRMLQGLGQVPFDPPNVKGWAGGESWITTYTLLLRQQFLRRMIEATTVAPMEAGMMMAQRPNRRADRKQQLPADDGTVQMQQMQMAERRPVEGRSLRNAGVEVRLGPTLDGVESAVLVRTLLPRQPIDSVDVPSSPGVAVATAMLDTAYQLK
ncbi:MAG: DUF1800 domain-containing protein [Reyranella sp.]|jgi:uncharacterized protein (DUF1800 family)|uniref:DUF1800 domain-containing protein n=1 Tax=Reyranella sp. TaxID=1929291 RepID=UPI0025DE72B9|nr:DUF1800 domain-containing protein [Reyranella sp.]MBR2815834.1 DUF1800 domain-containing protein [Reyranella sp.]